MAAKRGNSDDLDFEISFFERLVREKPDYVDALFPLAEAYTRKGFYEKGLEIDRRLSVLRRNDPGVFYNLACSLALVGLKEDALKVLGKAIELGYADFNHLRKDPDLKTLHQEPQFQKWLKGQK